MGRANAGNARVTTSSQFPLVSMATTLSGLLSDTGRGLISQRFALAAQKSLTRFSTRNAVPSLGFGFELFLSSLGQAVVFRAPVVFRFSPKRGNPTFFFHSVQCGKERAWLDNKRAAGDLLDSPRDSQSVLLACDKGLQDQHVQSPLQEGCRLRVQTISPIGGL